MMELHAFTEEVEGDPVKLFQNQRRDSDASIILRYVDGSKFVLYDGDQS